MDKSYEKHNDSARGGIGMITAHCDGREIFFHIPSPEEGGPVIRVGQTVTYEVQQGVDGQYYAINLEVVDEECD